VVDVSGIGKDITVGASLSLLILPRSPGIIGHSVFSETQTFLTEVETEMGPMARVYEYDRYNSTVWQVDMMIVNGTFLAHPRITNPTPVDLRGYWWTW
jgi:hypothetical protein